MPVHLPESHETGKIADSFKFCHQGPYYLSSKVDIKFCHQIRSFSILDLQWNFTVTLCDTIIEKMADFHIVAQPLYSSMPGHDIITGSGNGREQEFCVYRRIFLITLFLFKIAQNK